MTFLQNVEDACSNSFHVSKIKDDLQHITEKYEPGDVEYDDADDGGDDTAEGIEGPELDELLRLLDQEADLYSDQSTSLNATDSCMIPETFKLDTI